MPRAKPPAQTEQRAAAACDSRTQSGSGCCHPTTRAPVAPAYSFHLGCGLCVRTPALFRGSDGPTPWLVRLKSPAYPGAQPAWEDTHHPKWFLVGLVSVVLAEPRREPRLLRRPSQRQTQVSEPASRCASKDSIPHCFLLDPDRPASVPRSHIQLQHHQNFPPKGAPPAVQSSGAHP